MTASKFIIEEIDRLVDRFPNIQCSYEISVISNTHFIEIKPKEFYEEDEVYAEEENRITIAFMDNYPSESICFVEEDDDVFQIKDPVYFKRGGKYDEPGKYRQLEGFRRKFSALKSKYQTMQETKTGFQKKNALKFTLGDSLFENYNPVFSRKYSFGQTIRECIGNSEVNSLNIGIQGRSCLIIRSNDDLNSICRKPPEPVDISNPNNHCALCA